MFVAVLLAAALGSSVRFAAAADDEDSQDQETSTPPPLPPPAPAPSEPPTPVPPPYGDSPASKAPPEPRRSVELAVGTQSEVRDLQSKTLLGGTIFAELGAPGLGVSWYRPTLRVGVGTWTSSVLFDSLFETPTSLIGLAADACPLGVALVSTEKIDLILSACGVVHAGRGDGEATKFWADGGGLGRVVVQIGRKRHFRGFISVDGGSLWRLSDPPDYLWPAGNPTNVTVYAVPNDAMYTFAIGGGLLFP
jgi:hypothetical protein